MSDATEDEDKTPEDRTNSSNVGDDSSNDKSGRFSELTDFLLQLAESVLAESALNTNRDKSVIQMHRVANLRRGFFHIAFPSIRASYACEIWQA